VKRDEDSTSGDNAEVEGPSENGNVRQRSVKSKKHWGGWWPSPGHGWM